MRLETEVSFVNALADGRCDVWCGSTKFTIEGDAPAMGEKVVILVGPQPDTEPTPVVAPVKTKATKKKGK